MFYVFIFIAYLIGSIHIGPALAKRKNVDLRKIGSGNIGFTNVVRALGWRSGLVVFAFEILKPVVVLEAGRWLGLNAGQLAIIGLAVIIGNIFPIFLGFRGGKGVATSVGVMLVLNSTALGAALLMFLLILWLTKTVSIGSLVGALTVCLFQWTGNFSGNGNAPIGYLALAILVILVSSHRSNIARLLSGKENRLKGA